jgi:AcrR family transcriptional regulator
MAPSAPKRRAAPSPAARGRGRPVDHDGSETRAAILHTALRLFGEAGYSDVSMEAIATQCGVNVRALYYHFASKRMLFEAAREEAFGRFGLQVRQQVLTHVAVRGRFDGYVDVYRNLHAADPHVLPFIGMALVDGMAVVAHHGSLSEAGAELFAMIEAVVDDAIAAGEVHPDLDRNGALQLISALSMGMALMSLGDAGDYPAMLDALDLLASGTLFAGPND